jgi:predicted metal-binding membrane protein
MPRSSGFAAMTSTDPAAAVPAARPAAPVALFLGLAGAAWVGTVAWAHQVGNGPGTMGLAFPAFAAMWTLMMAAMMLPSAALVAPGSVGEASGFTGGYLAVWAVTAIPAFFAVTLGATLAAHHVTAARGVAVGLFVLCALYQFSPIKARSVARCRRREWDGDETVAAGVRYGGSCVQCSWPAMALLIPLGVMQVAGMVVIAVALTLERAASSSAAVRGFAVAALVYGVAVAVHPSLAPGLHDSSSMMGM